MKTGYFKMKPESVIVNEFIYCWLFCCILFLIIPFNAAAGIRPVIFSSSEGYSIRIKDGEQVVFSSLRSGAGLLAVQPTGTTQVRYKNKTENGGLLSLSGGNAVGLEISESYRTITSGLIERTVTVIAKSDQRYYLDFGWKAIPKGNFYSFLGEEKSSRKYTPSCSGPEFGNIGDSKSWQTFPFLGTVIGDKLYGIIGDTPGMWENRSFMNFDKENSILSLCNGDGSARRTIVFPFNTDATSIYRVTFDGWQHIEQGEIQTWKTLIFSSDVKSLYDVQLAAHLALANAKGFNKSGIEAICETLHICYCAEIFCVRKAIIFLFPALHTDGSSGFQMVFT